MAHDTPNYGNIQYSDSPELQEELQGLKPGDERTDKIRYRVRDNEDGSLTFDIMEVILPEKSEPVTKDRPEQEGSVLAVVLSKEKVVSSADVK